MTANMNNLSEPSHKNNKADIMGYDDNHTRILKASAKLFLANGYDDTRLDEIVQIARVSKTSIYKLFGGKRELFIAMIEYFCDRVVHSVYREDDPQAATIGDVKATLTQWGHDYLKSLLHEDRVAAFRLTLSVSPRIDEASKLYYEAGPQQLKKLIANYLHQISNANLLKIHDPEIAAAEYMSLVRSDIHLKALFYPDFSVEEETIEKTVASAVKLFLRAYAPSEET